MGGSGNTTFIYSIDFSVNDDLVMAGTSRDRLLYSGFTGIIYQPIIAAIDTSNAFIFAKTLNSGHVEIKGVRYSSDGELIYATLDITT